MSSASRGRVLFIRKAVFFFFFFFFVFFFLFAIGMVERLILRRGGLENSFTGPGQAIGGEVVLDTNFTFGSEQPVTAGRASWVDGLEELLKLLPMAEESGPGGVGR